jgi:two-component system OmpR family response regulator
VNARTAVVIEDDPETSTLISSLLEQCGFTVRTADNGPDGIAAALEEHPVLVTVDLGLPGMDGYEAIRRIREFSDAYILVVSGSTEEQDLVMAFGAGADDYLTKPFSPRVLQARVQSVQRRPPTRRPGGGPAQGPALAHGELVMDPWARTVRAGGQDLNLTQKEFDLLRLLLESGRRVRSRAQLALLLTGHRTGGGALASSIEERTVDVYISNLRRKLRDRLKGTPWLQTVRGAGYRLAPVP